MTEELQYLDVNCSHVRSLPLSHSAATGNDHYPELYKEAQIHPVPRAVPLSGHTSYRRTETAHFHMDHFEILHDIRNQTADSFSHICIPGNDIHIFGLTNIPQH